MLNLVLKHGKICIPHKYWEFEIIAHSLKQLNWKYWNIQPLLHDDQHIFNSTLALGGLLQLEFDITRNTDHAGITMQLGVLWVELRFAIYDGRHWNYEKDTWKN